ncbi:MAG: RNA methyltransferase [Desulfobacterales bacterium]|nr:RNA methyltransferase [Desulfobacterales bacterium]
MKNWSPSSVYLALLHHPVKNKNGETIASAVTNLDLHDLSRVAKTYGVTAVYVITPLTDQQALVRKIISHWQEGWGSAYNPKRREALNLVRVIESLDAAVDEIGSLEPGRPVRTIATGAEKNNGVISFAACRQKLTSESAAYLLMLGTAWGLTMDIIASADYVLAPIRGNTGYNHLPVRAAAAIILDRVLGTE